MLDAIHRHPDANATELSQALGVTRSALTQMGARLVEKELVERYARPDNKKEKYFRRTALGDATWDAHQACHAEANQEMCAFLRSLTADEKRLILKFLGKVESAMPITRFDCQCHEDKKPCI